MGKLYKRQPVGKYILKILQNLGGVASKERIKDEIVSDETIDISYEDVYEPKESRKGTYYIPFNYDFGFGMKELYVCGLIEEYKRLKELSLTEKGRIMDYNIFPTPEQQALIENYWESKSRENHEKEESAREVEVKEINTEEKAESWKSEVLDRIKKFSPKKFEDFSRMLLSKFNIEFDSEKGMTMSSDHGIDGFGYYLSGGLLTVKVAIQCKRYTEGQVSEPDIDKFKGAMASLDADYGIFITTSGFTKKAIEKARLGTKTVTLINGQQIVELIEKFNLHIIPTYSLDSFYYEEN